MGLGFRPKNSFVLGFVNNQRIRKTENTQNEIKTLMKHLHQTAIKHLTYLLLNKRKLDNKQTPVNPP